MEGKIYLKERSVIILLAMIFSVGVIGHTISYTREIMLVLTPFTLVLTSATVSFLSSTGLIITSITGFPSHFITFLLEAIGVKTGLIFGNYTYGNVSVQKC